MDQRIATCGCGQLRVTVTGEPAMIAMCHCTACQKRSGSQFGSGAFFERNQVTIGGTYKSYSRPADSGKHVTNHFCPECGTNIAWEAEIRPGWIAVAVGSFADANFPAPTLSLFEASRHSWVTAPPGVRAFERGPGGPR